MYTMSPITILAGENLEQHRRVLFNGTAWVYADAGEQHHAVTAEYIASGGRGSAWLANEGSQVPIESATTLSAGATAHGANDGKVSSTTTGIVVGLVLEAPLAASNPAGILCQPDRGGMLFSGGPSAITGALNTEQFFDVSYTIPANKLRAGDVLDIDAVFKVRDENSTDTFTGKLYLGSTTVNTLAAVDSADNDVGVVMSRIHIRTAGAAGTAFGWMHTQVDVDAEGDPVIGRTLAEFAIDTTVANIVRASGTWSVAHADNDAALEALVISLNRRSA